MIHRIAALSLVLALSPAAVAKMRDYCPDRPGLGTPSCTIDKGHASLELGLADWTLDRTRAERDEQLVLGDLLLRYGVGDSTELQLGWTSFGRQWNRDRMTGARSRRSAAGDATIALRHNLRHPDGAGFSIALMPYATLPLGGSPIGAGDWAAGLKAPFSWQLDERFGLALTPEIDAAADGDREGRHLAYGAVAGLAAKLSDALSTSIEYRLTRDDDPSGHMTIGLAGLSVAWQPRDNLQFDAGVNGGLGRQAPDVELYLGVSRRF